MSAGNGPTPIRLVFLSDLPGIKVGTKVRFLGCVEHYSNDTGELVLKHDLQNSQAPNVFACVNIDLVLSSMTWSDFSIGEWINIVGYIVEAKNGRKSSTIKRVDVQAILLWSAGAINLVEYEESLREHLQLMEK
ncbi:MAG: hypothetical protein M1834_001305 [Cirrosporium novae-zelandiae]|nr:MAG: hypothetical protein M1834_001305 [Cirrosporium novae-zelandiae]